MPSCLSKVLFLMDELRTLDYINIVFDKLYLTTTL